MVATLSVLIAFADVGPMGIRISVESVCKLHSFACSFAFIPTKALDQTSIAVGEFACSSVNGYWACDATHRHNSSQKPLPLKIRRAVGGPDRLHDQGKRKF